MFETKQEEKNSNSCREY